MTVQNNISSLQAADAGQAADAYRAARDGAAFFDRSGVSRFTLTGPDRASWLQGLITNDVVSLAPGQGCYAAYLTPQGRMISDLRVLTLDDALLLDIPAVSAATVRERFELFIITEDVAVQDVTPDVARLAVHGPLAPAVVASVLAGPGMSTATGGSTSASVAELQTRLEQLPEDHVVSVPSEVAHPAGGKSRVFDAPLVAGSRAIGQLGFDIYVPVTRGAVLADALTAAGAVSGTSQTWNLLRLEAGTPEFGPDMDTDTIPLEAGIQDRAISLTKGCYVGQEIIIRVIHRGHGRVARRLVGLIAERAADGTLSRLHVGDVLLSGTHRREIGHVTSTEYSPALASTIALGYVLREFTDPGTRVDARRGD